MSFVVGCCCMLLVDCCLFVVVCCFCFVVCRSFVSCSWFAIVGGLLFVVHYLAFVLCCSLLVVVRYFSGLTFVDRCLCRVAFLCL